MGFQSLVYSNKAVQMESRDKVLDTLWLRVGYAFIVCICNS